MRLKPAGGAGEASWSSGVSGASGASGASVRNWLAGQVGQVAHIDFRFQTRASGASGRNQLAVRADYTLDTLRVSRPCTDPCERMKSLFMKVHNGTLRRFAQAWTC